LINACNLKPKLDIYSLNSYMTEKCSFIKLEIFVDLTESVKVLAEKKLWDEIQTPALKQTSSLLPKARSWGRHSDSVPFCLKRT